MMTPAEMVLFFASRAQSSARALRAAALAGDVPLAALNVRQRFKAQAMCGLLRWRMGQDPRADLRDAVAALGDGLGDLRRLGAAAETERELPLHAAHLFAFLLGEACALPLGPQGRGLHDPFEGRLDGLLARAVRTDPDPAAVEDPIAELAARKRCGLAAMTYRAYFDLLGAASAGRPLAPLVAACDALYLRRARDSFYSGGVQTDGGGPDNPHVVDYRLAAVLARASYTGESVHRWRW